MKHRKRWRTVEGDYHVFNRGARKLQIFADDADRGYFLRLLGLTAKKHAVLVTTWCLMGNHYHMSLRSNGLQMGRMVRDLEKTYARYFNKKTGHVGALFEGRFGSTWLPDMEAVAYVGRYIHANCRDQGLAPDRNPWSSCRAYLGLAARPSWLLADPILDWVGGEEAYRSYLAAVPPLRKRSAEEEVAQEAFVEHIRDRIVRNLEGEALPEKISREAVVGWAALRRFGLKPRVAAPLLGFSSGHSLSVVVSRLEGRMEEDPSLRGLLDQVLTK